MYLHHSSPLSLVPHEPLCTFPGPFHPEGGFLFLGGPRGVAQ